MPTLAIETSTLNASIALMINGEVVDEQHTNVSNHAEEILALITTCLTGQNLTPEDLDTIAVGAGPGSFTGLRIGMATAKGLCFALGRPLIAVSSLKVLAFAGATYLDGPAVLVPVMDARRKEIFSCIYECRDQTLRPLCEEVVLTPANLGSWLEDTIPTLSTTELSPEIEAMALFGDGLLKYRNQLEGIGQHHEGIPPTPSARALALLSQTESESAVSSVAPSYVRKAEAEIKFPNGNPGGTFSALKKN